MRQNIPASIIKILDRDYPHWKFPEISKEIYHWYKLKKVKFDPNFISGDFDGNGKKDYAIQIMHKDSQIVVAFIREKSSFKMFVLNIIGKNPEVCLWLFKRGEKDYDYDQEKDFIYKNDAIGVLYFEKAGASYIFKDGSFHLVPTSD